VVVTFHLGKSKIDQNFIDTIKTSFKNHDTIKIKVLETQTRDREEIQNLAEQIAKGIETDNRRYKSRVIGFTIVLNQFRKHKQK
jgi:RNA-binding protein YhbY